MLAMLVMQARSHILHTDCRCLPAKTLYVYAGPSIWLDHVSPTCDVLICYYYAWCAVKIFI